MQCSCLWVLAGMFMGAPRIQLACANLQTFESFTSDTAEALCQVDDYASGAGAGRTKCLAQSTALLPSHRSCTIISCLHLLAPSMHLRRHDALNTSLHSVACSAQRHQTLLSPLQCHDGN